MATDGYITHCVECGRELQEFEGDICESCWALEDEYDDPAHKNHVLETVQGLALQKGCNANPFRATIALQISINAKAEHENNTGKVCILRKAICS